MDAKMYNSLKIINTFIQREETDWMTLPYCHLLMC